MLVRDNSLLSEIQLVLLYSERGGQRLSAPTDVEHFHNRFYLLNYSAGKHEQVGIQGLMYIRITALYTCTNCNLERALPISLSTSVSEYESRFILILLSAAYFSAVLLPISPGSESVAVVHWLSKVYFVFAVNKQKVISSSYFACKGLSVRLCLSAWF